MAVIIATLEAVWVTDCIWSFLLNLKQVKYYQWGSSRLVKDSDTKEMLIMGTELWILSDPRDKMIIWWSYVAGNLLEGFKVTLTDFHLKCSTWRSIKGSW